MYLQPHSCLIGHYHRTMSDSDRTTRKMQHTANELSSSSPDLSLDNITRRKRGHNDEFTQAFEQFSNKMMTKLNEWKLEFRQETSDIKDSLKTLNETSQELKSEVNSMRDEYNSMQRSVHDLETKLCEIQEEVTSLKNSIQFHSDEQDDLTKRIELCSKEVQSISILSTEIANIKIQNRKLRLDFNQNEQRDRLLNIEIVGVPEYKEENLNEIILQLGKHTSIEISQDDIVYVNRVSSLSKLEGRPKNIVAKLRTRQLKDNIISQARKCRLTTSDVKIHGKVSPVFVNEHLTLFNKNLLKKTKEIAKLKEYQYVWTKNGRIYARKASTISAIQITEEEDLKKII